MSESAYGWEREERRDAIRAAEDAGEMDDRPTASDFRDEDESERKRAEDFEGFDYE